MKHLRNLGFGLFAAWLLAMALALPSPASGQNNGNAEHAGYQGIPLRGGSDRGAIQQKDSSDTQRYPSLPRRQNERDLNAGPVAAHSRSNQNDQNRGGYRGIPRSDSSNSDSLQRNETPNPQEVEPSGYSGIPRAAISGETQLVAQRDPR